MNVLFFGLRGRHLASQEAAVRQSKSACVVAVHGMAGWNTMIIHVHVNGYTKEKCNSGHARGTLISLSNSFGKKMWRILQVPLGQHLLSDDKPALAIRSIEDGVAGVR